MHSVEERGSLGRAEQSPSEIPQRESCQPTPATSTRKLVLVAGFVSQRARMHREELVTGRSRSGSLLSEIAAAAVVRLDWSGTG